MRYILVDTPDRANFFPFTLTRSLAECRVGIFTIQQRWEQNLGDKTGVLTEAYLQNLYSNLEYMNGDEALYFINASCIPEPGVVEQINQLKLGEKLISKTGKWIATYSQHKSIAKILMGELPPVNYTPASFIINAVHLLQLNKEFIVRDFKWVQKNGKSESIDSSNKVVNAEQIFIEPGAIVTCSNLNASDGPIYIGKEAVVMEGVSIRGSFVLGAKAVVKMNTSIYGSTSIGPNCLIGGEIKNSIIMGYSNKGHEGYMGDSIVGHWCNFGAGTCNSNIKNSAGDIQMWNEGKQIWETIGQKMGFLVGDYTRFAIHSSINTGTYVGVGANVFGNGLLPKNIPNFTWGITPGYRLEEVFEDINNWQKLKGFMLSEADKQVLKHLHHISA